MKICKYKGPAGECGELPSVRKGREAYDILCVPEGCDMFTPLTNLDRVRSMKVAELVELLLAGCDNIEFPWSCEDKDCDCRYCMTSWLALEVEEEE